MSHVAKLASRIEDAGNETRMLVLGAGVLLGFQFRAVPQEGFDRGEQPATT